MAPSADKDFLWVSAQIKEVMALARFGRTDEALARLRSITDIDQRAAANPVNAFVYEILQADLLQVLGDFAGAQAALERARATSDRFGLGSAQAPARFSTSQIALLLAQGREVLSQAQSQVRALIQSAPDGRVPAAYRELQAHVALESGDIAQAEQIARDALKAIAAGGEAAMHRRVDEPLLLGRLGRALLLRHRPAEAVEAQKAALNQALATFDPATSLDIAELHVALAESLAANGLRTEARVHLEAAKAIHRRHLRLGPQYTGPMRAVEGLLRNT
jgi:tetratricopeptide (TPR) repeat protein